MRVLVPGGCGYLGSQLTISLLGAGHSVYVLDPGWFGCKLPDHSNLKKVDEVPEGMEAVVYLAGLTNDSECQKKPEEAEKANITEFEKFLWQTKDIRPFIYLSSVAAYGNSSIPFLERDPLKPTTVYGEHKKFCENMLPPGVTILRPAGVFGPSPRMRFDLTVNRMVRDAFKQGKIHVHGGNQWRPHVHIHDLIDTILFFLTTKHSGVYNVAYDNQTVLETAERIKKVIPCEISMEARGDDRTYRVSSKKLERIGVICGRSVEAGAREMLQRFKAGYWKDCYSDQSMNIT